VRFIGLLRAINLAGVNKVPMADLRALVETLGMQDVVTLLNSGNIVFSSGQRATGALEKTLEAAAAKTFGFSIDHFVRDGKEWRTVIAGNPFPREAVADPSRLVVLFLKDAPTPAAIKALKDAMPGREVARVKGRHAYIYYPDGQGRSKLTAALLERRLGTRGTARNWNTVLKLGALAE
jgi:uncharacterized protein (DUF1697 family)